MKRQIQDPRQPRATTSDIVQSVFYIAAGINHFWHPGFYRDIMPDHYSHPDTWIRFTGVAEVAGGIGLLLPRTRRAASIGLCIMLVAFLDVHQFMIRHPERFPKLPRWTLWGRLLLQPVLIAWAWRAGRKLSPVRAGSGRGRRSQLL